MQPIVYIVSLSSALLLQSVGAKANRMRYGKYTSEQVVRSQRQHDA